MLTTWKAIAAYFQIEERTAKRWEKERGLPVHRPPGGKRGSVFAYTAELEAWLHIAEQKEPLNAVVSEGEPGPLFGSALPSAVEIFQASSGEMAEVKRRLAGRRSFVWMVAAIATVLLVPTTLWIVSTEAHAVRPTVARPHIPAPGAQELYLRGRYFWNLRTANGLAQAIDSYTQAIVKDPSYAEPYAGLAESYDLLPQFGQAELGDSLTKAKTAADRAIALDPDLAAAHRAKAFALFFWDWDIPGSDAEFKRAIALEPNSAQTHQWYASTLQRRLQGAECMREIDEALRLNPTSAAITADAAYYHADFGDLDAGVQTLKELERTQPTLSSPAWFLKEIDFARGDYPAYIEDARRYASITRAADDVALADSLERGWASAGKTGLLQERAKALKKAFDHGTESGFVLGQNLLLLGHPKDALRYFQGSLKKHSIVLIRMQYYPWAKALASDPGYEALFAEIRERLQGSHPAHPPIAGVTFRLPE